MTIRTLVPIGQADAAAEILAPRPSSLDGAVIGLYANVKGNSDRFLDALADLLAERFAVRQFIRRTEGEVGMGADGPYDEMAARCDLVIAGVGD
jgi:hypothetical protein